MTKELEQITPEYVIQPNAISQSIYECGTNSRKIIAMATSLLTMKQTGKDAYTVSFTIQEFLIALGITDGSRTRDLTRRAIKDCCKTVLTVSDTDDDYSLIPWFYKCSLLKNTDRIEIQFNPVLATLFIELKGKVKLDLIDIGKLQSKYAIRFYELAMSYAGFAGKNGNKTNCWYFEREVQELRETFAIKEKQYKVTKDFRVRVIDEPIEELNCADVGFKIEVEYIRKGKKLTGFRFCCIYESKKERESLPPADTLNQKENTKLMNLYPEIFEKFYKEELLQKQLFPQPKSSWERYCQIKALDRLKSLKGIRL